MCKYCTCVFSRVCMCNDTGRYFVVVLKCLDHIYCATPLFLKPMCAVYHSFTIDTMVYLLSKVSFNL